MKKLFILILLIFLVTGCGLQSPRAIKRSVSKALPKASLQSIEKEDDVNIYNYKYKNIEFKITNTYYTQSDLPIPSNNYFSNYINQVLKYYETDIKKIESQYNIDATLEDPESRITINISNYSALKQVANYIDALLDIIKDYYLQEPSDYIDSNLIFNIKLRDEQFVLEKIDLADVNYSKSNKYQIYQMKYVQLIDNNKIINDVPSSEYKKIPKLYLDYVYVNNKLCNFTYYFVPPKIVYNVEDEQYYLPVAYGVKNGADVDYIQKDIIEMAYPNSNYQSDNEEDFTTYNIGNNTYKMLFNSSKDSYKFYKNNKKLSITTYSQISDESPGATFIKFISLDDFANLVEMKTRINTQSRTLYFYN